MFRQVELSPIFTGDIHQVPFVFVGGTSGAVEGDAIENSLAVRRDRNGAGRAQSGVVVKAEGMLIGGEGSRGGGTCQAR